RKGWLFPADPRVFSTNSLSLAHGAVGVLLSLDYMGYKIEQKYIDWILDKDIDNNKYPPGFYIGNAGIAYGLYKIGSRRKAVECIKMANQSDLKFKSADMFYGAAGLGLVNLFFYKKTNEDHYIEEAIKNVSIIKELSSKNEQGYLFYENTGGSINHGFAFGASGISFFL